MKSKHRLYITLALLLILLSGCGGGGTVGTGYSDQTIIYGTLRNSDTLLPVEGATITLLNNSEAKITDVNGEFSFASVSKNEEAQLTIETGDIVDDVVIPVEQLSGDEAPLIILEVDENAGTVNFVYGLFGEVIELPDRGPNAAPTPTVGQGRFSYRIDGTIMNSLPLTPAPDVTLSLAGTASSDTTNTFGRFRLHYDSNSAAPTLIIALAGGGIERRAIWITSIPHDREKIIIEVVVLIKSFEEVFPPELFPPNHPFLLLLKEQLGGNSGFPFVTSIIIRDKTEMEN